MATTEEVGRLVQEADLALVLHEGAAASLGSVQMPARGRVVVVVGPEGGLTDEEVTALTAAGASAVRMGDEVLRTSTAGVAAVAALLARTDRWAT
jgi:16S rRNA (uracil1498-N3)-methyltransferase